MEVEDHDLKRQNRSNMNMPYEFFTQPYNGLTRTAHEIIIFGKAPRRRMKYHPSYHSPILAIHGPRPATLRCLECHVGEWRALKASLRLHFGHLFMPSRCGLWSTNGSSLNVQLSAANHICQTSMKIDRRRLVAFCGFNAPCPEVSMINWGEKERPEGYDCSAKRTSVMKCFLRRPDQPRSEYCN